MNFLQASTFNKISLLGDEDSDLIPNIFDCKPYDKHRDGIFGRAVNIFSKGKYGQSKEDYDLERMQKTSFERDQSGRVIKVFRNGKEVIPETWKSTDQLIQEYRQKEKDNELKTILDSQKKQNALVKKQIQLQKLKMEESKLKSQRASLKTHPTPTAAQQVLASMIGVPQPTHAVARPGYFIEYEPKLPKGYKWKKIPKTKSKQSTKHPHICKRCGSPLVPMPNIFGQVILICPRCNATLI